MFRSRFLTFVVFVSMIIALVPLARPAAALSSTIVISQVYGGGGNAGATLKNDFIELFNLGGAAVNVTGWSVQYGSATGTTWAATSLSGTIQPGHYYLVQEAAGAGGTINLPTPDATGTILMSATAAKVALVNSTTALTGTGCPFSATVVDFVGYGTTANCSETSPAPVLTNTTDALRKAAGCTETDVNSSDFEAGAPTPRNTSSPVHFCTGDNAPAVSATSPLDGATGVGFNTDISITFSEPVNVSSAWFTISCTTSGSHTAVQSGGPTTFTLDPTTDFDFSEDCTVTVLASEVTDQDTADPPDNMLANYAFSFTTEAVPPAPTFIHDIQGAAHTSPLSGQTPGNVPGIVTAKRSNGVYLQDPSPDGDPATSEGIFVFTSSAPTSVSVGDGIRVRATVSEFRPGGAATANLTTTELTSPTIVVLSHGNALPAATVIGLGGRMPPTAIIEDDATGSVETSGVFDPASDGIDFYESVEGMLVQINDPVIVGPTNSFNEIPVLPDNGSWAGPRTARGGILYSSYGDGNPERIIVDDAIVSIPGGLNVGDHFAGSLTGVVDYNFGLFMVELTQKPTRVPGLLTKEATAVPTADELAVATFNVENLDPTDPPAKFAALAGLIVNNLRSPDLLAIEEIQDNNGPSSVGSSDATLTWQTLIAAIVAAGGPTYDYRQIDPLFNQDGGEPNGNIRQGFLFRTDRGLSFVDRPGGDATTATHEDASRKGAQLTLSPGRIDPTNPAFTNSRKPLVGEFSWRGKTFFAIANHFNSKGGDTPLLGRYQPQQRVSETQRHQQAAIVNAFVDELLAADKQARIVVLGDLNDFEFSDTLTALKGGVLVNLMETLPAAERYSYVFEGNSQVLDQILVSPRLFKNFESYDSVHVNAEFADQDSDHDPQVTRLRFGQGVEDEQ
jgi:predicted extracellular nuclease